MTNLSWLPFVLLPLIAALIGWFTNYVAIYLLFKPEKPIKILWLFSIQGIFPKRQAELASKLGKMVADELFHFDDIREKIIHPDNLSVITGHINSKIDSYLDNTLDEMFIAQLFLSDRRRESMKKNLKKEVDRLVPKMIGDYTAELESQIDIEQIVAQKVKAFSSKELSGLLNSILKKEFRFIEILGAVVGLLVGLLQALISYFF